MDSYKVVFKPSVEKDLKSLSKTVVSRVVKRIEDLRREPLPPRAVKLSGAQRLYRIRGGDYRVVYEVDAKVGEITIHYVRHRREVYRGL